MAGAAQALQRASAEAAAGILDPATGAGMLSGFVEEEAPAAAPVRLASARCSGKARASST